MSAAGPGPRMPTPPGASSPPGDETPRRPTPVGARVLAGAGALAVGALFLVLYPLALVEQGCVASAATLAGVALPLVAFLGLLSLDPDALQRILARWTALDLSDAAHVAAGVVMAGTLFVTLGWGGAVGAASTLESSFGACALPEPAALTPEAIVRGVLLNATLFTLPVLLYVGMVHGRGPGGAMRALGLSLDGAGRALALGATLALAFILLLALLLAAVAPWLPEELLQNEQALAIARSVTLPAAIILAVGSGVGEEVFFRGFLQPRIGNLGTSLVFAAAHANYGSISEVVIVFLLSLALGELYRRTGNLLAPMSAHFTFNFVQLLIGMYAPEIAT